MTKKKEPFMPTVDLADDELNAYVEGTEEVAVNESDIPSFALAVNGKVIIVYGYTGEVNTDATIQFRNLFANREVGTYEHNGATVLVE